MRFWARVLHEMLGEALATPRSAGVPKAYLVTLPVLKHSSHQYQEGSEGSRGLRQGNHLLRRRDGFAISSVCFVSTLQLHQSWGHRFEAWLACLPACRVACDQLLQDLSQVCV